MWSTRLSSTGPNRPELRRTAPSGPAQSLFAQVSGLAGLDWQSSLKGHFRDGGFSRLYSVVSLAQVHRKALHYVWFGVVPLFQMVPRAETFHNYLREAYDLIPRVRDV